MDGEEKHNQTKVASSQSSEAPSLYTYRLPGQVPETTVAEQPPKIGFLDETRVTKQIQGLQEIPNNKLLAILACLFCFFPTGLVAIYFSGKVDEYNNTGDTRRALNASMLVRHFSIASAVLGLLIPTVTCMIYWGVEIYQAP